MRTNRNRVKTRAQSSLELLITVSFALIILLPIVILAFIQMTSTSSNLATGEAQAAATKIAEVAVNVGVQGPPAKQLLLIDMPPNIQQIIIGNSVSTGSGLGHQIIFQVNTNAGLSDAVAYVPINVTGSLSSILSQGTYLINITAESPCTYDPGVQTPCVVITPT
jgi:hypothetical protein